MRTATHIIDALGGPSKVAGALGLPVTTVHSWTRVNAIPVWRRDALKALAITANEKLSDTDFPKKSARRQTGRAA